MDSREEKETAFGLSLLQDTPLIAGITKLGKGQGQVQVQVQGQGQG